MNVSMNNTDIRLNEQRRQIAEAEAAHYRFAHPSAQSASSEGRTFRKSTRHMLVIILLLSVLMLVIGTTQAHDLADTGEGEAFSDAMLAYRMGHYHFMRGDYEKAVDEYTTAVEAIPEQVFEKSSDYAVMYWNLGNAQFKAGKYEDALGSYQHYLDLNSDSDPQEITFVQTLEMDIADGTASEMELFG